MLKDIKKKLEQMTTKLTETETEYRGQAQKTKEDAATKKGEAVTSLNTSQQLETEFNELTQIALSYKEAADSYKNMAGAAKKK